MARESPVRDLSDSLYEPDFVLAAREPTAGRADRRRDEGEAARLGGKLEDARLLTAAPRGCGPRHVVWRAERARRPTLPAREGAPLDVVARAAAGQALPLVAVREHGRRATPPRRRTGRGHVRRASPRCTVVPPGIERAAANAGRSCTLHLSESRYTILCRPSMGKPTPLHTLRCSHPHPHTQVPHTVMPLNTESWSKRGGPSAERRKTRKKRVCVDAHRNRGRGRLVNTERG